MEYLNSSSQSQIKNALSQNNKKLLDSILTIIKSLFYKYIGEEAISIRRNLFDFIAVVPSILTPYLLDGALLNEYKNYKKLVFNSNGGVNGVNTNLLNLDYVMNVRFESQFEYKEGNFINDLTSNSPLLQYLSKGNVGLSSSLIIQLGIV